jgi:hypothetical protein
VLTAGPPRAAESHVVAGDFRRRSLGRSRRPIRPAERAGAGGQSGHRLPDYAVRPETAVPYPPSPGPAPVPGGTCAAACLRTAWLALASIISAAPSRMAASSMSWAIASLAPLMLCMQ